MGKDWLSSNKNKKRMTKSGLFPTDPMGITNLLLSWLDKQSDPTKEFVTQMITDPMGLNRRLGLTKPKFLEESDKGKKQESSTVSTKSDTNKEKSTSDKGDNKGSIGDTIKGLLPLLALGGGGGLGIWGLHDLFAGKSKSKGLIKTLLGLLLAGAALYPMLTGNSLTDIFSKQPDQPTPKK